MHDLIDMFDETSQHLDDLFIIDHPRDPDFYNYISDIYPPDLHLNKANNSGKETSFLDYCLAVTFVPAFKTNAMTSDFL